MVRKHLHAGAGGSKMRGTDAETSAPLNRSKLDKSSPGLLPILGTDPRPC